MGRRSKYSSEFKAKVALEAIKEKETLAALAKRFDISPSKITEWKDEFLKNATIGYLFKLLVALALIPVIYFLHNIIHKYIKTAEEEGIKN